MFERLGNGWELAKQSFRVLSLDKELLLFPLMSGVACLLVLASFALPLWNSPYIATVLGEQQPPQDPLAYVLLFLFYFANFFVIVFFNSALVACAVIRFNGGDPTLADGLSAASRRLPQILAWALVAATVGWLLRIIESYSDKVGQVVTALLGAAWSIMTYFVVPVLVVENVGPIEALQRSISILKRTWGEALGANFGIGLITFLMSLVAILPLIGGVVLFPTSAVLGGALVATGVVGLLLVMLISSTLDAIVLAALYLYAARGTVPAYFEEDLLRSAFARR